MASLPRLLESALGAMDNLPVSVTKSPETLQAIEMVSDVIMDLEMANEPLDPPISVYSEELYRSVQHLSGLISQASLAGPAFGSMYEQAVGAPFDHRVNQFYSDYANGSVSPCDCANLTSEIQSVLEALKPPEPNFTLPFVCGQDGVIYPCDPEFIKAMLQQLHDLNVKNEQEKCQLLNLRNEIETYGNIIDMCSNQVAKYKGCPTEPPCVPCTNGVPDPPSCVPCTNGVPDA